MEPSFQFLLLLFPSHSLAELESLDNYAFRLRLTSPSGKNATSEHGMPHREDPWKNEGVRS